MLMIIIFIILLSVFRFAWFTYYQPDNNLVADQGRIDLTEWNISGKGMKLDGEWEYYPEQFIDPTDIDLFEEDKVFLKVPNKYLPSKEDEQAIYGYGTYRLKIILPNIDDELLIIRFHE